MLFVTVGSQKFQFNRLLIAVDELIEKGIIQEAVFAQIGCCDYMPKHYPFKCFLDRDEFSAMEAKADVIITHGGTGTVVGAIKNGKKVIAVPRLAQYGEHVDDHQMQIVEQFKKLNLICGICDCGELDSAIRFAKNHTFDTYESNTEKYIESIDSFLTKMFL